MATSERQLPTPGGHVPDLLDALAKRQADLQRTDPIAPPSGPPATADLREVVELLCWASERENALLDEGLEILRRDAKERRLERQDAVRGWISIARSLLTLIAMLAATAALVELVLSGQTPADELLRWIPGPSA